MVNALRSLGEVPAPAELERRVRAARTLAQLTGVEPPDELWARVQPAAAEIGRAGRVLPFIRPPARRLSRAAAVAAAAVLALGLGVAYFAVRPEPAPLLAAKTPARLTPAERAAARELYLSRVVAIPVPAEQLSPAALALAGALGAPIDGGRAM